MTLVWRPGFQFDADASTYIEAVEAADEAASPSIGALETNTRYAINNFVIGCKQDGIWSAIKASCILAGARTLDGALVPLVGTAPTNNNFVSGDYNRETGLVGNGSTKYLDSNRNNNADPQNSQHLAIWASSPGQIQSLYISSSTNTSGNGASGLGIWLGNYLFFRCRSNSAGSLPNGSGSSTGLIGVSRASNTAISYRAARTGYTGTLASQMPRDGNIMVFAEDGSTAYRSSARLAFYSIGEFLDLALLDARVTDLITAIGAAIP